VQHSLTIIAPVRNGEGDVAVHIRKLLEIAADLTGHFEVIAVDDASTDDTHEVLTELSLSIRQLKLVRVSQRMGFRAAIRQGMSHASNDFIMVQDYRAPVSAADICQLWELRNEAQFVAARAEAPQPTSLMGRLSAWGQALLDSRENSETPAIYMLRRESADLLESSTGGSGMLQQERFGRLELVTTKSGPRVPRPKLLARMKDLALGE
jgi:hypothetical protein